MRAAIAALPAGQRAAVALFHLGGLSHAEVAGRLGTRPGAVKTRLHKARGALRRELVDVHREEIAMPTAVPMSVADVRRPTDRPERHIVVLEEIGGERRLPIWIGTPEALSLVAALEEVELPRPGPYHFAQALLAAAGGALREVRVSRLADSVFYAIAVLADGSEVDARPSDALTLALVTGAPIAVEPAVPRRGGALRAASARSWPPRRARRPTARASSPTRSARAWPSRRASSAELSEPACASP